MRISIPNFKGADTIAQNLEDIGINAAITTGRKSGDILKSKQKSRDMNTGTSVVYQIPCRGCQKSYVGETGRGLKTRLAEHKRDVREHRVSNATYGPAYGEVGPFAPMGGRFNFFLKYTATHEQVTRSAPPANPTTQLSKYGGKQLRRATEAAYICLMDTTNTRAGFYTLSKCAAKMGLRKKMNVNWVCLVLLYNKVCRWRCRTCICFYLLFRSHSDFACPMCMYVFIAGAFHDRSTTPDTLISPIFIKFGERGYFACQKHWSQSKIAEVNSFLVIAWGNFRGHTGNQIFMGS